MFFSYLFETLKTAALGFLLTDYFRRNHVNKYNEILLNIGFNVIYIFSWVQINCKKFVPFLFYVSTKKNSSYLEFIKNNTIISTISKDTYLVEGSNIDYDFAIYWDHDTTPPNAKIIYRNQIDTSCSYEKCDIKFLLVEFYIGSKIYKCDLFSNDYNFYIKDNVLGETFFLYYLRYLHEDKVNLENNSTSLKIIDHNVEIKIIDFVNAVKTQNIRFHSNNYEIEKI